ncbi:MAG: hypothetical protein JWR16_3289 [Nevskia sp.]|nr:hypothetical protein [Nevskia sp.]
MGESSNGVRGNSASRLRRHRAKLAWVFGIVAVCLLVRLALPYLVKSYVNQALNSAPGYSGHVNDIHIALWRGAYSILGLEVRQNNSASKAPLFSSPRTELSVLWSGLLDGVVVAQVKTYDAQLTFAAAGGNQAAQTGKNANWGDLLEKLTPFSIDHFQVIDGQIHYLDRGSDPPVDVYLSKVNGEISNLTNREVKQGRRVATLHAQALAMDQAILAVDLTVDPFSKQPDFAVKARLLHLEAVRMKDFVRAYTLFDPKSGTLDVVVEATAKDGNIDGYVKPLFHDLELFSLKTPEQDLNPLHLASDALGSILNLLLQNQRKQQLATQVPFSGRVDDPGIDIGSTILNLLKNAVVKAFTPQFEDADKK